MPDARPAFRFRRLTAPGTGAIAIIAWWWTEAAGDGTPDAAADMRPHDAAGRAVDGIRTETPAGHWADDPVRAAPSDAPLPPGIRPRRGGPRPPVGRPVLADLAGVDEGLAVRLPGGAGWLMPHGGQAVLNALEAALLAAGGCSAGTDVAGGDVPDGDASCWPEASDTLEAAALSLVATCRSPLGIDLLLDQPRRWRTRPAESRPADAIARDRRLDRLIDPPLVVIAGAPNIGKSSLTNRLAGRDVSITADLPGTTRDAPEVHLDLAGLVVRWIDLPGLRPTDDPIERAAIDAAETWLDRADMIVAAADATSAWPNLGRRRSGLRIGMRADLGRVPNADVHVSRDDHASHADLAQSIRDVLVPTEDLNAMGAWDAGGRFSPVVSRD